METLMAWAEGLLYFVAPIAGIIVVVNDYSSSNLLLLLIFFMLWGLFTFREVH
jgi:hypothetical protein